MSRQFVQQQQRQVASERRWAEFVGGIKDPQPKVKKPKYQPPVDNSEPGGYSQQFISQYSADDLYPTLVDPACRCGPNWPLASYWPVYLGNFFIRQWNEEACYDQISDYFAYKGLLTRMMYFHSLDEEFWTMQKQCSTIDALVYFCSEEDARKAVSNCHRDLYYGHRLNVLSGRNPEYFDNRLSVFFKCIKENQKPVSETSFENTEAKLFAGVTFTSKRREAEMMVQFSDEDGMYNAVKAQKYWKPYVMREFARKQRLLEENVKIGILMAMNSNGQFLHQKPRPQILNALFSGVAAPVEPSWLNHEKPKPSSNWRGNAPGTSGGQDGGDEDDDDGTSLAAYQEIRLEVLEYINRFLTINLQQAGISMQMVNAKRRKAMGLPFLTRKEGNQLYGNQHNKPKRHKKH